MATFIPVLDRGVTVCSGTVLIIRFELSYKSMFSDRRLETLLMFAIASTSRIRCIDDDSSAGESAVFVGFDRLRQQADHVRAQLEDVKQTLIAVAMRKSPALVAVLVGILESENAFVWLPPDSPCEFLLTQCRHLNAGVLIADERSGDKQFSSIPCIERRAVTVLDAPTRFYYSPSCSRDCADDAERGDEVHTASVRSWREPMAYAMQTSGTTGQAKRVFVPFSCILPNILDFRSRLSLTSSDVILFSTALTFDPSIIELFLALFVGTELLMIPDCWRSDPARFAAGIEKYRPTVAQVTPSLLHLLPSSTLATLLGSRSSLRVLLVGGEDFPLSLIARMRHPTNATQIWNVYGTTEVSCWASARLVDQRCRQCESALFFQSTCEKCIPQPCFRENRVDIGKPLADTVFSVDENGELLIGGGRRCCIDGEWTTSDFIRTGDLVEVEPRDGRIFFVGRNDEQVKALGMRINTRQVEKMTENSGLISQCAALIHRSRLVVLVRLRSASRSSGLAALRHYYAENVPSHWHPAVIVEVREDKWPTNEHGKTDRTLLRSLIEAHFRDAVAKTQRDALRSLSMDVLAMDISEMDPSVRLRSLGVDSLRAAQLAMRIEHCVVDKHEQAGRLVQFLLEEETTVGDLMELIDRERIATDTNAIPEPALGNGVDVKSTDTSRDDSKAQSGLHIDEGGLGETRLRWQWNSGKCIDASPLIVAGRSVVIGSHSGRFAAVDLESGTVVWLIQLADRVEATAVCNESGTVIAVGCYDGCVYFVEAESGIIRFQFQTGDAVKTSAVFLSDECTALIGSHDRHFYRLDYTAKVCRWRRCVDGAVLAAPIVSDDGCIAILATLSSLLIAIKVEDGTVIWKREMGAPIFAPLQFVHELWYLFVGNVRGETSVVDATTGDVICTIAVGGALFGGPTLLDSRTRSNFPLLLLGTQNGHLLLLSIAAGPDGEDKKSVTIDILDRLEINDGAIVRAPVVVREADASLILVQTTTGALYRIRLTDVDESLEGDSELTRRRSDDAKNGQPSPLLSAQLLHRYPGETFGRPAIVPHRKINGAESPPGDDHCCYRYSLVVGSRDDMLYCHDFYPQI